MKFIVYVMVLFTAAIGYILALILLQNVQLQNFLSNLILALFWLLICLVTYLGAKRIKNEDYFKMISLDFLLTWIFCTVGVVIGYVVANLINTGSFSLDWNSLTDQFFLLLPVCLGPTATASLGLRD